MSQVRKCGSRMFMLRCGVHGLCEDVRHHAAGASENPLFDGDQTVLPAAVSGTQPLNRTKDDE
jgi:hypothetical protein